MPPDVIMDDDAYASSEDSDFAPDKAADHASSAGSDNDDDNDNATKEATTATAARKQVAFAPSEAEAEDAGFENSGDEAIIGRGKKRRRRDKEGAGSEDEGGEGGFVKTRSQRANEKAERRSATVRGPVTVDVDALWKEMLGGGPSESQKKDDLSSLATAAMAATAGDTLDENSSPSGATANPATTATSSSKSEMIKIKRTYNFAGQVHTEEKLVARDSAEAKLYLAEIGEADGADTEAEGEGNGEPKRLPPRKAFRSAFEPILDPSLLQSGGAGLARRTDLDLGLAARLQAREKAAEAQAKKLSTVEKSRMDWAGFVDREGIQDELALAGKSKGAFVDRQQFLVRTEMRREEEARRARLANKV